jgi:hypothetical protein
MASTFRYAPDENRWVESSAATLVNPPFPGDLRWTADISRMGWWAVARPVAATSCVRGRFLRGSTGAPGAEVQLHGARINTWARTNAAADGSFCLEAPASTPVWLMGRQVLSTSAGPWQDAVAELLVTHAHDRELRHPGHLRRRGLRRAERASRRVWWAASSARRPPPARRCRSGW